MTDHTTAQQPELLTLAEAAALLRAPVATLRYWRHLGTGPRSLKIGRHVLYRRDDLNTWIDTQHDQTSASQPDQNRSHTHPGPDQDRTSQPAPSLQLTTSRR